MIAQEFGISVPTVQNWLRQYRNSGEAAMVERAKRPQDWTAEERLQALIETAGLSGEQLESWCRDHGLHTHHLAQWRKEKASAETAALLVLKKKRRRSGGSARTIDSCGRANYRLGECSA